MQAIRPGVMRVLWVLGEERTKTERRCHPRKSVAEGRIVVSAETDFTVAWAPDAQDAWLCSRRLTDLPVASNSRDTAISSIGREQ